MKCVDIYEETILFIHVYKDVAAFHIFRCE